MDEIGNLIIRLAFDGSGFTKEVQTLSRTVKGFQSDAKLAGVSATGLGSEIDGLKGKYSALEKQITAQSAISDKYNARIKETKENGKKLADQHEELAQKIILSKKAYEEEEAAKGKNAESTEKLKKEYEGVVASIEKNNTALQSNARHLQIIEKGYTDSEIKVKTFENQLKQTREEIEKMALELAKNESKLLKFGDGAQSAGKRMQDFGDKAMKAGAVLSIGITTPVVMLGKKLLELSGDFEEVMSSIQALSGVTAKEKKSLEDLAIVMGEKTAFSAKESAVAIEEMIKAGVGLEDIINGGLVGALDLAAAGGIGLAEAAEIASTVLNAFRADSLDMTDAANILAGAANASATDVGELKFALSASASVASSVGMSFNDTATALAVFAQNGLKGSDAGTSLKTALTRLTPMTDKAIEQFAELGLLTAEGTSAFYDQAGSLKPLNEISQLLTESMADLNDEQRIMALYTMFGSDAIRGANILVKEGAEGINKMNSEMQKFTAAEVAAEKMNNFKGKVEELGGAAETLAIKTGSLLLPLGKAVVNEIKDVVTWVSGLDNKSKSMIITIAAVAAATGPVIATIGAVSKGIGSVASTTGKLISIAGTAIAAANAKAVASTGEAVAATAAAGANTAQAVATTAVGTASVASIGPVTAFGVAAKALAGPMLLAVAVIGAFAYGATKLYKSLREADNPMRETTDNLKDLSSSINENREALEGREKALEDTKTAIQGDVALINEYKNQLDEVTAIENKSVLEKERLKIIVEQLNGLMPELNLAYDAEADSLSHSTTEIEKNIEAWKRQAEMQAYQDVYNEGLREKTRLEVENQTLTENSIRIDAQENALRSENTILTRDQLQVIKELKEQRETVNESLDENNKSQELNNNLLDVSSGKIDENIKKQAETAAAIGEVSDEQMKAIREMERQDEAAERNKRMGLEVTSDLTTAWERYVESVQGDTDAYEKALKRQETAQDELASVTTNMFGRIEKAQSISAKDATKNLKENTKVVREWSNDITMLAEAGVDKGFLEHLRKLGPGAREITKEAVKGIGEDATPVAKAQLAELEKAYQDSTQAASDAAINTLSATTPDILLEVEGMTDGAQLILDDAASDAKTSGENYADGYADGITENAPKAAIAAENMVKATDAATNKAQQSASPSKIAKKAGGFFSSGYYIGVGSDEKGGAKAGLKLVNSVLGIVSNEAVSAETVGKRYVENLSSGVSSSAGVVEAAVKKLNNKNIEQIDEWLKKKKEKIELSALDEIKIYSTLARSKEISVQTREELDKRALKASQEFIDSFKKINGLAAEEEMRIWDQIREKYVVGTEARAEADKNLLATSKEFLTELKNDNEMTSGKIAEFWDEQRKKYAQGTAARTEADKEYLKSYKAVYDEVLTLQKNYDDELVSLQKKYAGGVFDNVEFSEDSGLLAKEALFGALYGEVKNLEVWTKDISTLMSRGIDEGFVKEVEKMGISYSEELNGLLTMSETELSAYVELWQKKNQLAREQAIRELEPLQSETEKKIKDLTASVDISLEEFSQLGGLHGEEFINNLVKALNNGAPKVNGALEGLFEEGARARSKKGSVNVPLDLPSLGIPVLHSGGMFKASNGAREGLALLESGERVLSRSESKQYDQQSYSSYSGDSIVLGEGAIQINASSIKEIKDVIDLFKGLRIAKRAKG